MDEGDMDCDVAIVGAGLAGASTATLLSRSGLRVALIDSRHQCAPCFKAEKIGADQAQRLRKLELIDVLARSATAIRDVKCARRGKVFRRSAIEHYGIYYHDLVNSLRRELPAVVDLRIGDIRDVETGPEIQRLVLDDGSRIQARLLVLACGPSNASLRRFGIGSQIVSHLHSVTAGFSVEAASGRPFDFDELMYWSDLADAGTAFLTLFPLGSVLRGNLFTYWNAGDERLPAFRADPLAWMNRWMRGLTQITGPLRLVGPVVCRPVSLRVAVDFLRPGMAVLGDAFLVVCPATGRGVSKALNDVEQLCRYVPQWMSTPGMGLEKVSQFYDDPIKRQFDRDALDLSFRMRKTAIDPGLWWQLRRRLRAWKWLASDLCRGMRAGG